MIRFPLVGRLLIPKGLENACSSGVYQISTQANPLQFKATPALCAEPMRKKKKIDPNIIRMREERKKKKIEKEIRRLQKVEKQLKPVGEFQIPACLNTERDKRIRNISLSEEETEKQILMLKEWSKLKNFQFKKDVKELNRIMDAQKVALNELRLESEELYQAAVKIDESLIPLKFKGPTVTPCKEDYQIPDGNYKDVSRNWE